MSGSLFTPRVYQEQVRPVASEVPRVQGPDKIGTMVLKFIQYLVAGLFFLIPVFFIPGLPASLGFDKVMVVTAFGLLTIILLGLSSLRYTKVSTVLPYALGAFWLFVVVSFISGALSGDIQDALRGSVFEQQTAGFFAVMALAMTVPLVLQRSKLMALRTLMFFGAAAFIAVAYTLVRVFLADGSLALKSFGSVTVSPIGSFNDMAIFAALTVILSLITLLQLPLKRGSQIAVSILTVASVAIMAVVNFFHLWIIVGFFGLLLLVYIFSRDTLFQRSAEEQENAVSPYLIGVTLLVCVVSIVFVVAGDYVGAKISNATEISYVEVRPSVTATLDIVRGVYSEDLLLGTGPNRFTDAWRMYKDQSINETIFWNTNFSAGFGFVPTTFVTTGLLGGLMMLLFHVLYLQLGYKMLLRGNSTDTFWYYFGVVSFVAAVFLWGISYVYVSGPVILLLAALFTGLSFVAYQALVPNAAYSIPLVNSRRRGFFLMTVVIVLITASVSAMFTIGQQYVAQAAFTKAQANAASPEELQTMVSEAYQQYNDDIFVQVTAQTKIAMLRSLLGVQNPSKEEQEKFVAIAGSAIADAEQVIKLDPTSPNGYSALAQIRAILATAGLEGFPDLANGSLEDAKWRDPFNPIYPMISAYMAVQLNDAARARTEANKALELKRNYSEALYLLSQLDIRDGNIESAIATTRQMVTLEPNNPTRLYQLGVLLAANKDLEGAVTAYETAIRIDNDYANARYMLGLALLELNRRDDALTQLRIVRETNQDNEQLKTFIGQVEANQYVPGQGIAPSETVNEGTPTAQGENGTVVTPGEPNTNLVSPVNNGGQQNQPNPAQ